MQTQSLWYCNMGIRGRSFLGRALGPFFFLLEEERRRMFLSSSEELDSGQLDGGCE